MGNETSLRQHLVGLLDWGDAHMTWKQAAADFPAEAMNVRPPNVSYTPWQLLEHVRITQWDILDFCRNPGYVEMQWPKDYWPPDSERADQARWDETLRLFRADLDAMKQLALDTSVDLYAPIPHGQGQTILREIVLVADHSAYHLGEFAILRQVMGTWPASHR